jgi:hypothetical protein
LAYAALAHAYENEEIKHGLLAAGVTGSTVSGRCWRFKSLDEAGLTLAGRLTPESRRICGSVGIEAEP